MYVCTVDMTKLFWSCDTELGAQASAVKSLSMLMSRFPCNPGCPCLAAAGEPPTCSGDGADLLREVLNLEGQQRHVGLMIQVMHLPRLQRLVHLRDLLQHVSDRICTA